MKHNDGFTFIELLVTISVAALVTIAAATLLLLSARVQHSTTREAEEQQQVRIVMTLLENMAAGGDFDTIRATDTSWQLLKQSEVKFEYVQTEQSICRGAYDEAGRDNEILLTGLSYASVTKKDRLLCVTFETEGGATYSTRIYCRTGEIQEE